MSQLQNVDKPFALICEGFVYLYKFFKIVVVFQSIIGHFTNRIANF